ncbi:hypothetical protein OsJ_28337 [Oryza sativa Japonica Group]|uniref:Uncharacterized protein n=2 Tax=Oryza sativa subsp. japonica TaxID=39947 RepID=A3BVX0_ORYSJ|nr:hypothetical protein OsJ_28337 [Oryza sativa Japonica Group]
MENEDNVNDPINVILQDVISEGVPASQTGSTLMSQLGNTVMSQMMEQPTQSSIISA